LWSHVLSDLHLSCARNSRIPKLLECQFRWKSKRSVDYCVLCETFLRMNSHICKYAEARNLKNVKLLCLALSISVILTVLVHFSLSVSPTNTPAAFQHHPDEVANPGSALKESTGNATNTETYFNAPGRDDQTVDEQPATASCPDAVNSADSRVQVSDFPSSENGPVPAPLPDGRIFSRGELPYGYLPTCSPKDRVMPFVPVEPD
jgi:hypothetical protein